MAGIEAAAQEPAARAADIRPFQAPMLAGAGKALSSGAAAFTAAAQPLRQVSPRALALDGFEADLRKLAACLEGLSTCAPPARKSMVEAEVERRRAFQGTLADLKGALAGGPLELVDAIGAAFGSLDLPGVFTSGNLSRLIDSALGLIGTTLADSQ